MNAKAIFNELEGMSDREATVNVMIKLEKFLIDAGCEYLGERTSRRDYINLHYLSGDGKYVTTFIIKDRSICEACIYDADVYEEYLAEGGRVISLIRRDGNKGWEPVLWFKGKFRKMHRLAFGEVCMDWKPGDREVDHIYHTHRCSIRETLRTCEGWQNRINKPSKCEVEIGDSLGIAYDDFNYKPLQDFSETWYALILWKMLGIPEDEVMEYQRVHAGE